MTKLLINLFAKGDPKDPAIRRRIGCLGSMTGIVMNIVLFCGKLLAGVIAGSISVMADAFNNLSDAGSSLITLVGFRVAGRPADREHPFGHGRMEYVSGLIISFVILMMGFELGKSSVSKIIHPEDMVLSRLALVILIVSVAAKLWMFLFNRKLGKYINSQTLRATALDSLTDSVATCAVMISMLISVFTGLHTDGIAGLLVSLFIVYTGVEAFRGSVTPLLGARPDSELVERIYERVMSYPEIVGVHDLMVHDYGVGRTIVSLHAEVPVTMDFGEAHELIDIIEDDLKSEYKCVATIHMDPVDNMDEETVALKEMCRKLVSDIDPKLTIHDFRMTKGTAHVNLLFDVVVPFGFGMTDGEVAERIRQELKAVDEKYFAVVNVDKDMS